MAGNVRVLGKHEYKHPASSDAPHDCLGPIRPEFDVPRSHPTGDVGRLKMVANSVCYLFVLTRMTNKHLRRHASPVRKAVLLDVSTGNSLHKIYGGYGGPLIRERDREREIGNPEDGTWEQISPPVGGCVASDFADCLPISRQGGKASSDTCDARKQSLI